MPADTNNETKACQNCKKDFTIEPVDFAFYEKVKVPAPTFCPDCRMQRRMAYRNERTLYKRDCSLCGKSVISAYPADTKFPVYCSGCWWSDKWDPVNYGQAYDSSKPFLTQWKALQGRVPRPYVNNVAGSTMINSEYSNCSGELKNCYLVYGSLRDEDCAYTHYTYDSRDCFDVLYGFKSESCYECLDIDGCYNLFYSESCVSCRDSYFLFDCRNCSDCVGCTGLRNKQYYILNKEYSKEDYFEKLKSLNLNTRDGMAAFREQYKKIYYSTPRRYYHGQMNKNFSGDYTSNNEDTSQSFYIRNSRGCKYVFWCNNAQDVYDYMSWGDMELSYECVSNGFKSYLCLFTDASWDNNRELEYCSLCYTNSSLLGCIGLRNKKYCILNTQYSEEEYKALREKIILEMTQNPYKDARGIPYPYGEFPPIELSPFYYADTVAQEHFGLTQEDTKAQGYRWSEPVKRDYKISVNSQDIGGRIGEVSDEVKKEVIACLHQGKCEHQCTEAFRITDQELGFYRRMNIPLPLLCYNCRHGERVAMRNPLKLWKRKCQCAGSKSENGDYVNTAQGHQSHAASDECSIEFETAYGPDSKATVYCEGCYQAEII
jgi:hypothetical protein